MRIAFKHCCLALSFIFGAIPSLADDQSAVKQQASQVGAAPSTDYPYGKPRDFAHAMQLLHPLSVVEGGDDVSVCGNSLDATGRFADAVDYAESMGSYSLIIWKNGECQLEQYFAPFDRDTRPESASMHKSVLGLLIAAAIADGHLAGADSRIGEYIGEWSDDPRGDITLRHLLTMSSGLEPMSREGGIDSEGMRFLLGSVDIRAAVLGQGPGVEPGSVFRYSGVDSQLLLMVLESATGMDYVDYASTRLWQPLGAADAYVWDYTQPYRMPRAHMSWLATARDWLRIGLLLKDYGRYGDNQVIPKTLIEEATSPGLTNPNYAWQMWLGEVYRGTRYYNEEKTGVSVPMSEPFAVDDMIFFDGFGGQRVYISRGADLVIVRQGDMRVDWDDAALPNLVLKASAQ